MGSELHKYPTITTDDVFVPALALLGGQFLRRWDDFNPIVFCPWDANPMPTAMELEYPAIVKKEPPPILPKPRDPRMDFFHEAARRLLKQIRV